MPQVTQTKDEALRRTEDADRRQGLARPRHRGIVRLAWNGVDSAQRPSPVAIAGGGIGGLACALALARQGFRSLVLEQAREFGEVGVGLQVAPNALSVLDALGVGAAAKKNALLIERLLMMDGVTGEEVANIPLRRALRRTFRQSLRGVASRRHPRRAARRLPRARR